MSRQAVVLVHGLWMQGLDMMLLKKRLDHYHYKTFQFIYPSISKSPSENARLLHLFTRDINLSCIHFVCHSLGGLIVRHLFHYYPDQKPGRIVTLGSPHQSSMAAEKLCKTPVKKILLGKSIDQGLLGGVPPWTGKNELGVIAGDLGLGLGKLIPGIAKPNDGTVSIEETRLSGMKDHKVMHVSHSGLLISRETFISIDKFLSCGHF